MSAEMTDEMSAINNTTNNPIGVC